MDAHKILLLQQVQGMNLKNLEIGKVNSNEIFSPEIPAGNFSGLESLKVQSCSNVRNILASSTCRGMTKLQYLWLEDCSMLEEVISPSEDPNGHANVQEILFPHLKQLTISKLPKLQRFCHLTPNLELPSLEFMKIEECPMLESFSRGSQDSAKKFLLTKEVQTSTIKILSSLQYSAH